MAIQLQALADGVFLYVWEGKVTLDDIRANMHPQFHAARHVVFDLSNIDSHPFRLILEGFQGHRKLSNLEHVHIVYRPGNKTEAEFLVKNTIKSAYSMYLSREEAIQAAMTHVPQF